MAAVVARYFTKEKIGAALNIAATKSGEASKKAGEATGGNPGNPGRKGASGVAFPTGSGQFSGLKAEFVLASLLILLLPLADREAVETGGRFRNWIRQLLAIALLYAVLIMLAAIGPRSKRLMTLVGFLFLLAIALSNRFGVGAALLPRIFQRLVDILSPSGGETGGAGGAGGVARGAFASSPLGGSGGSGGSPGGSAGGSNETATGGGGNASSTGRSGRGNNGRRGSDQPAPRIPSARKRSSNVVNINPVRIPSVEGRPVVAPKRKPSIFYPSGYKPPYEGPVRSGSKYVPQLPQGNKPGMRRQSYDRRSGGEIWVPQDSAPESGAIFPPLNTRVTPISSRRRSRGGGGVGTRVPFSAGRSKRGLR